MSDPENQGVGAAESGTRLFRASEVLSIFCLLVRTPKPCEELDRYGSLTTHKTPVKSVFLSSLYKPVRIREVNCSHSFRPLVNGRTSVQSPGLSYSQMGALETTLPLPSRGGCFEVEFTNEDTEAWMG